MPISISERALANLRLRARAEGLEGPFLTKATLPPNVGLRLQQFLAKGFHGEMDWLAARAKQRGSPDQLWPDAKSALLFALPYGQDIDVFQRLTDKSKGVISIYAQGRDYHDIFKGKLKRLAQVFSQEKGVQVKVFVDTAPLMEKPLAQQAGLGWQGKHTNLVSRNLGSWFFIGAILTDAELLQQEAEPDHCGSCRACLDICPTKAFPAPYQLDARRCISYLTIEHKGVIAEEFRVAMGNRIYGCDDCLAICPWNKFAQASHEAKLKARHELMAPALADLISLDETSFRKLFSGSPIKRTGRNRFVRNCLIAAGNSGDLALVPVVQAKLSDISHLVRGMAVWALKRLVPSDKWLQLKAQCLPKETHALVIAEWMAR